MRGGKPLGEREADRAHGEMDGAARQRIENAALAEHRLLDRAVVGQHGDHQLAARGLAGRVGERRALADQGLGLGGAAVIDGQRMTRGQ